MDSEQTVNDFVGETFPERISSSGKNFIRMTIMNICDGVEIPDIEKIAFYTIASSQKLCGDEEKFDILAQAIAFFDYELQSKIFIVSPEMKKT